MKGLFIVDPVLFASVGFLSNSRASYFGSLVLCRQCCRHLVPRLFKLPVDVVGSRLTKLLLSRFVVINSSASTHLMPYLLTPAKGECVNDHLPSLLLWRVAGGNQLQVTWPLTCFSLHTHNKFLRVCSNGPTCGLSAGCHLWVAFTSKVW